MLLSQQRVTPKISDVWSKPIEDSSLDRYIPSGERSWVGSAREGLRQILLQAKVTKVALPAYTCKVVLEAVKRAGCQPILYDAGVVPKVKDIQKIISEVQAVVVCYNFGFMPEMDTISELCQKNKVIVIEDCAQALGAKYKGKLAGSFGDYALFSFGLSKNIGFCGGLIVSKTHLNLPPLEKYPLKELLKIISQVLIAPFFFHPRIYPWSSSQLHKELVKEPEALAYSCPTLAQRVIVHQFQRYDAIIAQRQRNALFCWKNIVRREELRVLLPSLDSEPSSLYLVLLSRNKTLLRQRLAEAGIEVGEMLTFCSLDENSTVALQTEKELLTFALYRPQKEIEQLVKTINSINLEEHGN